jgi:hypothetical protein
MDRRVSLKSQKPTERKGVQQLDTQDLINGVSRFQLSTPPRVPVQWESTASFLNADFEHLKSSPTHGDVSDTRMIIGSDFEPVTPIRRSISGSSLNLLRRDSSDEMIERRPQTVPAEPRTSIDFAKLYQSLLTLPLTQRNVHFKSILAKYLQVLEEHDIDPSTDKFIITIYNQLHINGNRSKLERVIDVFISEPCNEAMKLSNCLHFKEFNTQAKFYKLWLIKRRKMAELQKNEYSWEMLLKKRYLDKWIFKHKIITKDFDSNADLFISTKSLMKFWDIWRANIEECQEMEQVALLKNEQKFFQRWIEKMNSKLDAAEVYEHKLLKRTLKQWRLKSLFMRKKEEVYFRKWKSHMNRHKHMEECALDLELALHGGFFFSKWLKAAVESVNKEGKLGQIYEATLKRKSLYQWKQNLDYKLIENAVIERRGFFLKQFVMGQFKKKFENEQKALMYENSRDVKLKIIVLKNWHNRVLLKVGERSLQSQKLQIWKKRYQLTQVLKKYGQFVQRRFFNTWIAKYSTQMNVLELGMNAFESYTKVIYLNNWKTCVENIKRDELVADGYFVGKFFHKSQEKKVKINAMEAEADNLYENDPMMTIQRGFLQRWIRKHDKRVEDRLMKNVLELEAKFGASRMKASLQTWYDRYQSYLDQEQLFKEDFLQGRLLRPILDRWLQKHDLVVDMEAKANHINNLNLLSTGFTKMQLALLRIQELQGQLLEFQEDSDLKLILKHLNLWSLQLMKIRRDKEIISRFQMRWSRAHLRAILQLWQDRTFESQSSQFTSFDASFDIDDSPTKGKARIQSSPLNLRTPQKPYLDVLETSTMNFSRGLIPGSERIKRKRMEALKSHYSRVKHAIPSPLKNQVELLGSRNASPFESDS